MQITDCQVYDGPVKIALLSNRASIHTVRWANGLSSAGHDIILISLRGSGTAETLPPVDHKVRLEWINQKAPLGYFLAGRRLREILAAARPDVLNCHYASGYGTLARISGFQPLVLSVWGADVYDFPRKTPLHRLLVRMNLEAADRICSTSRTMARQTSSLLRNSTEISITPFGVDTERFQPSCPPEEITIGTVKTLSHKYGIDLLIKAFADAHRMLKLSSPETADKMKLLIVGGGPQHRELKALAVATGIGDRVEFAGPVEHSTVPGYLSRMSIYIALSRLDSESFGVAILEASACSRPVIVSDVGGLPEVVLNGKTGIVVPRENPEAAAKAIRELVLDKRRREELGDAGRNHVLQNYSWDACIKTMSAVYQDVMSKYACAPGKSLNT